MTSVTVTPPSSPYAMEMPVAARDAAAPAPPEKRVTVLSAIVLAVVFFAMSSLGAATDMMPAVSPLCHALWRSQGIIAVCCLGMVARTLHARCSRKASSPPRYSSAQTSSASVDPSPRKPSAPTLTPLFLTKTLLFAVSYSIWLLAFFVALNFANVLDAYMFNQGQMIYVLLFKIVTCRRLPNVQYAGVVAILAGGYMTLSSTPSMVGIVIAGAGGVAAVLFVHLSAEVQSYFSLLAASIIMQSSNLVLGSVVAHVMQAAGGKQQVSFVEPLDPHFGIFGWMSLSTDEALVLAYMVLVCGMIGMVGYTWASSRMPTVFVHAVLLLGPGMASVLSVASGTGADPSLMTWLGFAAITVGCGVVVHSEHRTATAAKQRELPRDISLKASLLSDDVRFASISLHKSDAAAFVSSLLMHDSDDATTASIPSRDSDSESDWRAAFATTGRDRSASDPMLVIV